MVVSEFKQAYSVKPIDPSFYLVEDDINCRVIKPPEYLLCCNTRHGASIIVYVISCVYKPFYNNPKIHDNNIFLKEIFETLKFRV